MPEQTYSLKEIEMPRPTIYGEKSEQIRVPKRIEEHIKHLIQTIWIYVKNHPETGEDIVLEVFTYLIRNVMEFRNLDIKEIKNITSKSEEKEVNSTNLLRFRTPENTPKNLPIAYTSKLSAGIGRETTGEQDIPGEPIDIHQVLIKDPEETRITFVVGDSMNKAGINDGDLLIFKELKDSWANLRNGTIVVAQVEGNQTVKRFDKQKGKSFLRPESDNEEHQELELKPGMDVQIVGTVLYSIHSLQSRHSWQI